MPSVFFAHGSPMNAIERNKYTDAWSAFARTIPVPRAIVMVSAHWYVRSTAVTAMERPETIHDFGGFPPALYAVRYPAPGAPEIAQRVAELLAPAAVTLDRSCGLDHGTWSVLIHAYPKANVPVIQLAIDGTKPAKWHYELARRLRPLRDEGVLIAGSGNVVHNLARMRFDDDAPPYPWGVEFDAYISAAIERSDDDAIVNYERAGDAARLAVPMPDHYLPFVYVAAQRYDGERLTPITGGLTLGGAISMLSAVVA